MKNEKTDLIQISSTSQYKSVIITYTRRKYKYSMNEYKWV